MVLLNHTKQISHTHVCLETQLNNLLCLSCSHHDVPNDNTYIWFIVPHLLNGLSSLLVSMTVLEFICVQAPRTTQGLLRRSWLIYEGIKGFLVLVSLGLFWCVSRQYRY